MALGDITVNLNLDGSDFEFTIKNADKLVKQFNQTVKGTSTSIDGQRRVVRRWANSIAEAVIGLNSFRELLDSTRYSLSLLINPFIEANANLERMSVIMQGLAKEAENTEEAIRISGESVEYLMEMVRSAPFSMNALQNAFIKFRAAGIDPTNGSLQALVDSVAKFGGDDDLLGRAAVAIQQMAGKGVVSMEELRQQLGEAVPEAMQLMADGLGVSMGELTKIVETGTLEAQGALDAMFLQMEMRNSGAAEKMMTTWTGLVAQFRAYRDILLQQMGDAGLFDELKTQLSDLVDILKTEDATQFAREVGEALTEVVRVTRMVVENFDYVLIAIKGIVAYMAANWAQKVITNMYNSRGAVAALGTSLKDTASRMREVVVSSADFTKAAAQRNAILIKSGQALSNQNEKLRLSREEFIRFNDASKRVQAGLVGLRGAVTRLGTAMWALAGPVGAVIMIAYEVASAFDLFGDKIDEIREKAAGGFGVISEEEFEDLKNGVSDAREEVVKFGAAIDKYTKGGTQEVELLDRVRMENATNGLAEARYELNQGTLGIQNALAAFSKQSADSLQATVELQFSSVREQLSREQEKALREAQEWKEQAKEAGTLSPTELEEQFSQRQRQANMLMARETAERKRAMIKEKTQQAIDIINADKNMDEEIRKARIQGLRDGQFKMLKEVDKNFDQIVARLEKRTNEGLPQFAGKGGVDIFTSKYKSALVDIAGMQAEIAGESINMAKTLQQVRNLSVDPVGQEEYQILMQRHQLIKEELVAKRELESLTKKIAKQESRLVVDAVSKGEDNPYLKMSSGARQLNQMLEQSKATLKDWNDEANVSNDRIEEMEAQIVKLEGLARRQSFIDINKTVSGFEDVITKLNEQMMSEIDLRQVRTDSFNKQMTQLEQLKTRILQMANVSEATKNAMIKSIEELQEAMGKKLAQDNMTATQKLFSSWMETSEAMESISANAFQGVADEITNLVVSGKADFDSLAASFTKMVTQMIVQWGLAKAAGMLGLPTLADGGVVGSKGEKSLKTYANGGIAKANNPQLAVFGEGSMNEAFVPLPDGRSIPVNMNGTGQPNVQINMINQSGQPVEAEQQSGRFDGERYILDVVLKAANRPGNFRQGMKGALS
ncbi:tape measure protein [Vibrio owensii]|uniref:tape measure protein n=2 Tax=Vibrio harveyi group TaxID=717610 RepID=UPI003390F107